MVVLFCFVFYFAVSYLNVKTIIFITHMDLVSTLDVKGHSYILDIILAKGYVVTYVSLHDFTKFLTNSGILNNTGI